MNEELYHHGIKGMKWGVRRTPAQLGHVATKSQSGGEKKTTKTPAKKTPGKSVWKTSSISDDELQRRINRLNMEEQYEKLVERHNERNSGIGRWAKDAVVKSLKKSGENFIGWAADKLVDKIKSKLSGDKSIDIFDYLDEDVRNMDSDTIAKVATWYENANKIKEKRDGATGKGDKQSPKKEKSNQSSASSSKLSKKSQQRNAQIMEYIIKDDGYRLQREAERMMRDPRNQDKDSIFWLV